MKQIQLFLLLCLFAGSALSQSSTEFTHTIDSKVSTSTLPAKDFWIAIPQIYNTGDSGKYAEIYIASPTATTVHIRGSRFAPVDRKLKPMEQFIFKVETQDSATSMETIGSGVVQNKGIHVWSEGADLSVYAYIRNAESAGGTMILPVSSWGMEHVVVGFASAYAPAESKRPGEFCLVAAEDSTVVEITPKVAIGRNESPANVLHPAGKKFTVVLSRGQTVQFIQRDSGISDLTETVITSSKPIGVFSAVQRARIQYLNGESADFICEMMPPVCAWGKKYKTTSWAADQGGVYRVVASKDNQVIYWWNNACNLNQYESCLLSLGSYTKWESDAPFLLVSYIVPSSYEHAPKFPAMLCETPEESYQEEIFFQVPNDTQWVAVTLERAAVASTTIDGRPFVGLKSAQFSEYDMYHTVVAPGAHSLKSDSAAGSYVYGTNTKNSFAWGGSLSPSCIKSEKDTIAPIASIVGDCNQTTVTFADTQSKIMDYAIDSLVNLRLDPDAAFISGNLHNIFSYTLSLDDRTKPGIARISVYDREGNATAVTSTIDARPNPIVVPSSLEIAFAGSSIPNFGTFELTNTTLTPVTLSGPNGFRFANAGQGFELASPDLSEMAIGAKRTFLVRYLAPDAIDRRDTLVFGDECTFVRIPLASKNIGPIAGTTGADFGCVDIGESRGKFVLVDNNGLFELTVTGVTFDDAVHFAVMSPAFPVIAGPETQAKINVRYTPDAPDTNCTIVRFMTKELGELTAQVCGCGLGVADVNDDVSVNAHALREALRSGKPFAWLAPTPNPANLRSSVRFVFGLQSAGTVKLELFDLEGKYVSTISSGVFSGGEHEVFLGTTGLAAGSYLYRYTINGISYTGKLTLR